MSMVTQPNNQRTVRRIQVRLLQQEWFFRPRRISRIIEETDHVADRSYSRSSRHDTSPNTCYLFG